MSLAGWRAGGKEFIGKGAGKAEKRQRHRVFEVLCVSVFSVVKLFAVGFADEGSCRSDGDVRGDAEIFLNSL